MCTVCIIRTCCGACHEITCFEFGLTSSSHLPSPWKVQNHTDMQSSSFPSKICGTAIMSIHGALGLAVSAPLVTCWAGTIRGDICVCSHIPAFTCSVCCHAGGCFLFSGVVLHFTSLGTLYFTCTPGDGYHRWFRILSLCPLSVEQHQIPLFVDSACYSMPLYLSVTACHSTCLLQHATLPVC